MTENTEQPKKDRKKYRRDIIIAVIIVLVIVQAVNLFIKIRSDRAYNAEIEQRKEQITVLEKELTERKVEIEKLGGNVEDLEKAVEELEMEKERLLENKRFTDTQLDRLRNKVEGFQELLILKDEEIERLEVLAQNLSDENIELKTEKNQLTANLNQEQQSRKELEEQMEIAARLKAENINIYAINSRGRLREDEFKSRFIDKIRIEFNIEENELAPIEGKEIMIRIVTPDNNILFDVATGSGTFMFKGKEEFYTAKQQILFDNTRQKLIFDYDKGSEWEPGRYELEVYTEDYLMGEKAFLVK